MAAIPHFLIIGAQKAGTTAAARNLSLHPDIDVFSGITEYGQKEIEFYNQHWDRGISWYAANFQSTKILLGEKTAELLHRKICHERMFLTNPKFKLVVLLRSPIERAYSQWKMATLIKGDERDDFETLVERELVTLEDSLNRERFYDCESTGISCWKEGYLLKGMYAEQLQSVYKWFPKDQVFIAVSEQIRCNPTHIYADMFEFLEVPSFAFEFSEHFVSPPSPSMSTRIRSLLSEIYRTPNERLYSMLGMDIPEWQ